MIRVAGELGIPVPVASALVHATREALANVAAHAGTGEAWVTITLGATLEITVRDAGAGFDPARVDAARLGAAPLDHRAGRRPGRPRIGPVGTGPGDPGQHELAGDRPGGRGGHGRGGRVMVSHAGAVRDVTEAAVPRFAAILAAVLPLGLLVQALAELPDYRHPAVPVAVWLSLLAAAWWLVPRVRGGGLTRRQAAAAMAVAVAAVSAVGWDRRPHSPAGALDWSILGAVWLLALAALSRPAWEWVPGALLVLAVNGFFILRLLGTAAPGISRLAAATYVMALILGVFAALRPTLRVHAGLAARRAELASRLAAERAAIAAIAGDRRGRFALLELEALPLLRGIAGGSLDPAGEEVRQACARHATTLRRALVDRARLGRELLAGLEPALSAARQRGLQVEVQLVGDPGLPSPDVTQATLGALGTVLRALPPQAVTLTVLAQGSGPDPAPGVELYLTFRELPPGVAHSGLLARHRAGPLAGPARRRRHRLGLPRGQLGRGRGSRRDRRDDRRSRRGRPPDHPGQHRRLGQRPGRRHRQRPRAATSGSSRPRPAWTACWPGRGGTPAWSCSTWTWGTGPRPRATWRPSAPPAPRCWSCPPRTSPSRSGTRFAPVRSATC